MSFGVHGLQGKGSAEIAPSGPFPLAFAQQKYGHSNFLGTSGTPSPTIFWDALYALSFRVGTLQDRASSRTKWEYNILPYNYESFRMIWRTILYFRPLEISPHQFLRKVLYNASPFHQCNFR